jgi:hypothetical protein
MTDQGRRFCPRCGTALVAGMSFCPGCGLNTAEIAGGSGSTPNDQAPPLDDGRERPFDGGPPLGAWSDKSTNEDTRAVSGDEPSATVRRLADRGARRPNIVVAALIIAAALVAFGLLTRPQPPAAPAVGPGGAAASDANALEPSALIVGLTIQTPHDGQVVATKEVTVIGLAPPGLKITRDVSFGLDQHATADGTGHWAIAVGLDNGENKLKFRIGDDRSTEQEIRVTYTPQAP